MKTLHYLKNRDFNVCLGELMMQVPYLCGFLTPDVVEDGDSDLVQRLGEICAYCCGLNHGFFQRIADGWGGLSLSGNIRVGSAVPDCLPIAVASILFNLWNKRSPRRISKLWMTGVGFIRSTRLWYRVRLSPNEPRFHGLEVIHWTDQMVKRRLNLISDEHCMCGWENRWNWRMKVLYYLGVDDPHGDHFE